MTQTLLATYILVQKFISPKKYINYKHYHFCIILNFFYIEFHDTRIFYVVSYPQQLIFYYIV